MGLVAAQHKSSFRHQQSRRPLAFDQMSLQNRIDVGRAANVVPNPVGIDDHAGSQLAAVEASGAVDAHVEESKFFDAGFHVVAQMLRPARCTGAARMPVRAAIGADEQVSVEKHHYYNSVRALLRQRGLRRGVPLSRQSKRILAIPTTD